MCNQRLRILILLFWTNCCFSMSVSVISKPSPHIIEKTHIIQEDGSSEPIVLDCEYDAKDYQSSLLVKWLKDSTPIYQWIKGHKPTVYPASKGLIDEEYEISSNPIYRHRAIRFPAPTKEVSGNYTCMVTMHSTQTIQMHLQVVDVSQSNFEFNYLTSANETLLTCKVENVYPKPSLLLTSEDNDITFSKISEKYEPEYNGFFNATSIVSANGFDDNDEINCTLSFPGIEYNITKTLTSSASIIRTTAEFLRILFVLIVITSLIY